MVVPGPLAVHAPIPPLPGMPAPAAWAEVPQPAGPFSLLGGLNAATGVPVAALAPGLYPSHRWPPTPPPGGSSTTGEPTMMELTNSAIADMRHVVTTFSSVLLGRPVSEEAPLATLDCILLASAGLSLAMARNACPDLFAHDCVVPEALPAFTGGIAGPTSCDGLCVKTMVDAIWVARASADAASSARTRVAASAPAQDPAGDSLASGFATRAATLSSGLGPAGGGSASCHPIRVTSSPVQGSAGDDLASGSATREATGSPGSGATGNGSVSCDAARAAGHPPALAAPAGPAGHTPRCRVCGDPSNSSNNCAAQDLSNSVVPPDTHLFGCFTIASIGRRFMGCPDVGLNHVLEYARHLEEMNACNPLGHRVEYPEGTGNGCFVVSADLANIGMLFDPTDASGSPERGLASCVKTRAAGTLARV